MSNNKQEFFTKLLALLNEYNVDMTAEMDISGECPVIEFSGYESKICDELFETDYDLWMFCEAQYIGPDSEIPEEWVVS